MDPKMSFSSNAVGNVGKLNLRQLEDRNIPSGVGVLIIFFPVVVSAVGVLTSSVADSLLPCDSTFGENDDILVILFFPSIAKPFR